MSDNGKKMEEKLDEAASWIEKADKVCFFLGAGISVASGVPTFRGKYGLWTFGKQFMKIFSVALIVSLVPTYFMRSSPLGYFFFVISLGLLVLTLVSPILPWIGLILAGTPLGWNLPFVHIIIWWIFKKFFYDGLVHAKPNDGHNFIANFANYYRKKKEVFIITQNVDNLEMKAGFSGRIYQLHGNFRTFCCTSCGRRVTPQFSTTESLPWFSPKCTHCGRRNLRTGCLLFADMNNPFPFCFDESLVDLRGLGENDVMILVGTSGVVAPANSYPERAKARIIDVNIQTDTSFSSLKRRRGDEFMYIRGEQDTIFRALAPVVMPENL